jgi:beta-glucosidase
VSPTEILAGDTVSIAVDVTNYGNVAGEGTVMFFTRDPVASVSRPVLELKAVRKLELAPGETKTARIELNTDELTFLDRDLEPVLEPGQFDIFAGPSAREADLLKARIILLSP